MSHSDREAESSFSSPFCPTWDLSRVGKPTLGKAISSAQSMGSEAYLSQKGPHRCYQE